MAYIFTDLPADSSELDTYNGYHVARTATIACGGPVRRDGPEELILTYKGTSNNRRAQIPTNQRSAKPMTRVIPGRRHNPPKFVSNGQLASLAIVPCLCYVMVWMLGRF
ncbi:MAG: hypothetical protein K8I27_00075 [Planctomycetes bacterium]|nr:hypothetical protein [Planctomycetota bacterium]